MYDTSIVDDLEWDTSFNFESTLKKLVLNTVDEGPATELQATRDATRNTYAGAFGQIPGLSVPCGFSDGGLPIGVQLEAAWWQEPLLLRVGHSFQKVTDWHLREPG